MEKIEIGKKLFRTLDIRGVSDPQYFGKLTNDDSAHSVKLTPDIAEIIGRSISKSVKPKKVVLGWDARISSPKLAKSMAKGLVKSGVDVDVVGLCSTDQIYFSIGHYKYDIGVMITASHAVKKLNGIKISKYKDGKVVPVAKGSGLEEIRDCSIKQEFTDSVKTGSAQKKEMAADYKDHILSFFNYEKFHKQKIVLDPGNGVAGIAYEEILNGLPIDSVKINWQPNGEFPNHEPDPMISANMVQIKDRIKAEDADFGVAWDGDSDRVAFITKDGEVLTGSHIGPMLIFWVMKKHPGATVIDTPPMSLNFHKLVRELGGKVEYSQVGNSNIKIKMEEFDSPFAVEESDHFMFKETFNAENGILPLLIILDTITKQEKSFDEFVEHAAGNNVISGDINLELKDKQVALLRMEKEYSYPGNSIKHIDGLYVSNDNFHFNIRPSLNDPVLRLNIEAKSREIMNHEINYIKKILNTSTH